MFGHEPRPHRHRLLSWLLALAVLLLITEAAAAGEPAIPLDGPRLAQAPEPLCFCWNNGRKIAEGSSSCIRTSQGPRIAACSRVTNLMSWQVTETPCPES